MLAGAGPHVAHVGWIFFYRHRLFEKFGHISSRLPNACQTHMGDPDATTHHHGQTNNPILPHQINAR